MEFRRIVTRFASEPTLRWYYVEALVELVRGFCRGYPGVRFGARVKLHGRGEYRLCRGSRIHDRVLAYVAKGAVLELGRGAWIGARTTVKVESRVTIGEASQISWQCQVLDTDFHNIYTPSGTAGPRSSPVIIGARVLVGAGAIVLKGVRIGDDAVVGAGSVVSRDVAQHTIVAGNPASEIGKTSGWK